LDSNYIANKTNDDDEEKVTFGPHIYDVASQKLASTSKLESMPVFSLVSSLLMPTLIFDDVMRSIILAGLSKFLKKQFKHVLLSGLSSLRGWWISKSSKLIENLKYFHVNPSYLMDMMGIF
jgi:hypothetical protein